MPSDRALSLQAVSLETKQVTVISQGQAVTPRYVPTGHIAYKVGGRLVATPFDIATLRVTAPPVTVMEDVDTFSFSADGTLVYSSVDPGYNIRASTPVWVDRDGSITALPLPAGVYDHPRLSPDGRAVVLTREMEGDRSLWVYDTARVTLSKLTFSSRSDWPVWGPGDRILYGSNRAGTQYDILWTPVDRSGPEDDFLVLPLTQIPRAVSPAGDILIFEETYADRPNTLWRMPLDPRGEPRPLFATANGEMMPTFSPDGRWVAYVSGQSERSEVYVRSSTGEGRIWPISNDGGVEPVWSFSGRELFYRADDRMMVVDVTPSDPIAFGKPRVLFEGVYLFGTTEGQEFDVTRDGKRFLMLTPQQLPVATPLNVVVNWFDDLRRRVPGAADSD